MVLPKANNCMVICMGREWSVGSRAVVTAKSRSTVREIGVIRLLGLTFGNRTSSTDNRSRRSGPQKNILDTGYPIRKQHLLLPFSVCVSALMPQKPLETCLNRPHSVCGGSASPSSRPHGPDQLFFRPRTISLLRSPVGMWAKRIIEARRPECCTNAEPSCCGSKSCISGF